MTAATVAIDIAAPIERVFDLFTDIEHGAEHVSNIRKVEVMHHKAGARIEIVPVFEPLDHGTKVRIDFDLGSPGLPPAAMAPLRWAIAGKVREVIALDLEDLKRAIEGPA